MANTLGTDDLVMGQLANCLLEIEQTMDGDCLTYVGPIAFGADNIIRISVEELREKPQRHGKKLIVILETAGGYVETARRISDALRHHYRVIEFLIPNRAMSAGTILALSGDEIWMDYYSVLGPIDPQVPNADQSRLVPAVGQLLRYQDLLEKANKGLAGPAELEVLLNFDQGDLFSCQQARDLSVSLLEEWLVKYKFKTWRKTETRGDTVTVSMKKKRATEIAKKLNDPKKWNSHGIGINMNLLRKELKLKINDFSQNKQLNQAIKNYHYLLIDYLGKQGQTRVVHTRKRYESRRR